MTTAPRAERLNICFIGRTNVGKSTIVNKLVDQDVSIISEHAGTTTDPVLKRFELHPLGAVTFFDTAGYDDRTLLGEKRFNATMKVIYKSDLAIIIIDKNGLIDSDLQMIDKLIELKVPYFVAENSIEITDIKKKIIEVLSPIIENKSTLLENLVKPGDKVVLVMPIDSAAPKGRIILPQLQVLREILDIRAIAMCCQETELAKALASLAEPPDYVITDSQVVDYVNKIVPENVPLTTFSILFARYRGELEAFLDGLKVLKTLNENDLILIAEACSHHSTDEDIGTVKIPKWLSDYLGFSPVIHKISGSDFPDDLEKYKLVIHCGGCMLTKTEMMRRVNECRRQGVAITNYGMIISKMKKIRGFDD